MRREVVHRLRDQVALVFPPWDKRGAAALQRAKRAHLTRGRPVTDIKKMSKVFADRLAKRTSKAKARGSEWPGLLYCPSESRRIRTRQRGTIPQKIRIKTQQTVERLDAAWAEQKIQRKLRAQARAVSSFKITLLHPSWGNRLWLWLCRKTG